MLLTNSGKVKFDIPTKEKKVRAITQHKNSSTVLELTIPRQRNSLGTEACATSKFCSFLWGHALQHANSELPKFAGYNNSGA